MKKANGYTLVESVIAMGLITLIGGILVLGMFQYRKIISRSQTLHMVETQINDIVENVRPNIHLYQILYDHSKEARDKALNPRLLPMAWDAGRLATANECPTCSGRYGFTIQPYPGFPGLFLLTLRLTHRDWPEPFRDYTFLVTTK